MITLADIKKHIRQCKHRGVRYNWLGFVENKDLAPEVEALFSVGNNLWDWVKGNSKLWKLQDSIE
jgi:hypothetical protein